MRDDVTMMSESRRKKEFLHYPLFRVETLVKTLYYRMNFKERGIIFIIHLLELFALQHLKEGRW